MTSSEEIPIRLNAKAIDINLVYPKPLNNKSSLDIPAKCTNTQAMHLN
jgi:hypothetical protein